MANIRGYEKNGVEYKYIDQAGRQMMAAVENTSTATAAHAVGTYLIYNDTLYEVTAAIAVGGTLTVGTNIAAVSGGLGGDVAELKSAVDGLSTATGEDVGKALKVNAVSGGKVTAWGFQNPGMSTNQKNALLNCLQKVAWIDDDGPDYYDSMYDALFEDTWQITNNLSYCTTSNGAQEVTKNAAYSATITPAGGYTLTGATVVIMMGNMDITASAYDNGVISIASVTAPLSIAVSAVQKTLSSISAVYAAPADKEFALDATSLDDFKPYLTVTATYTDASTAVVAAADYTLSGTLVYGSNTITVTYGSATTTVTVTIDVMYKFPDVSATTLTRSDDNTRSSVISVTDGLISVTGNNNDYMYIWKNGTAHTSPATAEWFSLTQGQAVKFEAYDITWQAPVGASQQLQPKWTTTAGSLNLMSASFDIASGSSGSAGQSAYETASYGNNRTIGCLNVHWSNLPSAGGTISFRIKMTVDGVRYF